MVHYVIGHHYDIPDMTNTAMVHALKHQLLHDSLSCCCNPIDTRPVCVLKAIKAQYGTCKVVSNCPFELKCVLQIAFSWHIQYNVGICNGLWNVCCPVACLSASLQLKQIWKLNHLLTNDTSIGHWSTETHWTTTRFGIYMVFFGCLVFYLFLSKLFINKTYRLKSPASPIFVLRIVQSN